jgi:hypothetical protein
MTNNGRRWFRAGGPEFAHHLKRERIDPLRVIQEQSEGVEDLVDPLALES